MISRKEKAILDTDTHGNARKRTFKGVRPAGEEKALMATDPHRRTQTSSFRRATCPTKNWRPCGLTVNFEQQVRLEIISSMLEERSSKAKVAFNRGAIGRFWLIEVAALEFEGQRVNRPKVRVRPCVSVAN
jgi:hypothetical protein